MKFRAASRHYLAAAQRSACSMQNAGMTLIISTVSSFPPFHRFYRFIVSTVSRKAGVRET
jgi:hypothetical protein